MGLALPGPAAGQTPDWVVKGSHKDGARVAAVGSGRSVEAAVLAALAQVSGLLGDRGPEYSRSFGPVAFKHKSADNLSSTSAVGKQVVKGSSEARLSRGRRFYQVTVREVSESSAAGTRERLELAVEAQGLSLNDLLSALTDQGFSFQQWCDPSDFTQFVALERGGRAEAGPTER